MLEIRNLSIKINDKEIIKNLNLILNSKDKLAVIGEEGNGKSTLLKAIYDESLVSYASSSGEINKRGIKIGYLPQFMEIKNKEMKVLEFLEIEDNYYEKVSKLYYYLKQFDLNEEILEKKILVLSGGEKVKIALLKIILQEPDIFLLDEPSNDLDIDTLKWLELWIKEESRPIMFISHDEVLLNNTANRILHLEMVQKKQIARHTLLNISYDNYVNTRSNMLSKQEQIAKSEKYEYQKQQGKLTQIMQKVDYQQDIISRSDPHGARLLKKKMKSLKSQEKRFEKIELTEIPDVEEQIKFLFEPVKIPVTKIIIDIHLCPLKIGDKILSQKVDLKVQGPEHIVIIGDNGVGKTTLIKIINGHLQSRSDIKVGYMSQDYEEILNTNETPVEFLCNTTSKDEISKVRSYLGNIKFTKEEMINSINCLSGGSQAKLIILKFILEKCDVLLLDEPTRNVSPLSNPIICSILKEFNGTIISISHDRKFIEKVGNIKYHLTKDSLIKEI